MTHRDAALSQATGLPQMWLSLGGGRSRRRNNAALRRRSNRNVRRAGKAALRRSLCGKE